jgi:hypothetical protein
MKGILYVIILCSAQFAHAQKMGIDLFIRLPQVVNYNFTKPTISYAPLISTGLTLRYKKAFVDVGSFICNKLVWRSNVFSCTARQEKLLGTNGRHQPCIGAALSFWGICDSFNHRGCFL